MKKLLALLLSLVMILSLAACSSGAEETVAEEPAAQAKLHKTNEDVNTETLRRERHVKRRHPVLRMVGIGCGSHGTARSTTY